MAGCGPGVITHERLEVLMFLVAGCGPGVIVHERLEVLMFLVAGCGTGVIADESLEVFLVCVHGRNKVSCCYSRHRKSVSHYSLEYLVTRGRVFCSLECIHCVPVGARACEVCAQ